MASNEVDVDDDEVRAEYDFSNGMRNPSAQRMRGHGNNLILLEPELSEIFRDMKSVNEALRLLLKTSEAVREIREKRAS